MLPSPMWLAGSGSLAIALALHGAIAAAVVGFIHMACGPRFGMSLILFYLTGSRLTKWGAKRKADLEDGYREGGQRGATQVLANSAGGAVAALAARYAMHRTGHEPAWLVAAFLAHYSCCCADTWASEVGICSKSPPRLITSLRVVQPGTNGGISVLGTAAGLAGGLLMGISFWAVEALEGNHKGTMAVLGWRAALLGLAAGGVGNLADSLLGATLQFSGWSESKRKVVNVASKETKHISGADLLSNDAVNALAALLTSLGVAFYCKGWS